MPRNKKVKSPSEYNKKYDNINAKAQEMGYNSVGQGMKDPEFVAYVKSVKNKQYKAGQVYA